MAPRSRLSDFGSSQPKARPTLGVSPQRPAVRKLGPGAIITRRAPPGGGVNPPQRPQFANPGTPLNVGGRPDLAISRAEPGGGSPPGVTRLANPRFMNTSFAPSGQPLNSGQQGVPSQTIGPGNNLINKQLGVGDSTLGGLTPGSDVSGQRQQLGQDLGNLGFRPSADATQARGLAGRALQNLAGAPSRQDLAQQSFDQLQAASEPAFQKRLQGVGRKAAALGRIGAGITTSELGDVTQNRERDLGNLRAQLGTQAAGLRLSDLLNQQGAALGQAGALQGLDLGQLGARQGILGQRLGAQGQFFGQDLSRFGANLGAQQQGFGQNLARTGVAQQQQGFQAGLNRNALQNRVQQQILQQQFGSQNFNNQLSLNRLLAQLGFGGGGLGGAESQLAQLLSNRGQGTIGGIGQLAQGIAGG